MQVKESAGERKLLIRLQLEGLMKGALWQEPIFLGVKQVLADGREVERATIPEVQYPRSLVCLYLDGPPHLKDKVMERDSELRELLRGLGWRVLEFPYTPPLSDARLKEITTSIQEALPH